MNTNVYCVWMCVFTRICICTNIFENVCSGAYINQCKLSWKLSSQHSLLTRSACRILQWGLPCWDAKANFLITIGLPKAMQVLDAWNSQMKMAWSGD